MDGGTTAAIVTGTCALTLLLVKYIIQCVCPGHITFESKSGCKKPNELNPLVTLKTLWEEKWTPQHEPIGKNKYKMAKQNKINNIWNINIQDNESMVHIYREDGPKPESGNHYLYVKIILLDGNPDINLFVKRFIGDANCWDFTTKKIPIYKVPVIFNRNCCKKITGEATLFIKSLIDIEDITKEQIGITIKGKCKCIIEEAYYSDKKISILSCPKCFYSFYNCHEPKPISCDEN